jgi:transposase
MRTKGSAQELENRRRLAVQRIHEGWPVVKVSQFLGVHLRTVRAWLAKHRADPENGLKAKPSPGRTPKLTAAQEAIVLSWFTQNATAFGFATELWTAARVAILIERFFAVPFHARYLSAWLAQRRITPQKPQKQPRERDQAKIDQWLAQEWPRIKKNNMTSKRRSCCSTKQAP